MQTLHAKFSPAGGNESRAITLNIGDPIPHEIGWSVVIEVIGFDEPYVQSVHGEDWAQAIELAAKTLPVVVDLRIAEAGGGDLNPSFFDRDPQSPDPSE